MSAVGKAGLEECTYPESDTNASLNSQARACHCSVCLRLDFKALRSSWSIHANVNFGVGNIDSDVSEVS